MAKNRPLRPGESAPVAAPGSGKRKKKPNRPNRHGGGGGGNKKPNKSITDVYDEDLLPDNTSGLFDPANAYGNKTDDAYFATDEGEAAAGQDHDAYNMWLLGNGGGMMGGSPFLGGETRFEDWMTGSYFPEHVENGYAAAYNASGGHLSYRDYMDSIGWGPGDQNSLITPAPQRDTGNPFTSSSGVGATPNVRPLQPALGKAQPQGSPFQQRLQQMPGLTGGSQPQPLKPITKPGDPFKLLPPIAKPPAAATPPTGIEAARLMYRSLTPQQRGTNAATSFRPGRWAIF